MEVNFSLTLDLSFNKLNILRLLKHIADLGYVFSCEIYYASPIEKQHFSVEEAADFIIRGHKFGLTQVHSEPLTVRNLVQNISLVMYIRPDEKSGLIKLSKSYYSYRWGKASKYFDELLPLLDVFKISTIRIEDNDLEPTLTPAVEGPSINVAWVWRDENMKEQTNLFFHNIKQAGFEIFDESGDRRLNEEAFVEFINNDKTMLLQKGPARLELISGASSSCFFFIPQRPYQMKNYDGELALDLAFYFLIVLKFCQNGKSLWLVETTGFDRSTGQC